MKALSFRKLLLVVLALGIVLVGGGLGYALTVHELPDTGLSTADHQFGSWIVTNQSDFQQCVLSNVDINSSPGDAMIGMSSSWLTGFSYRKSMNISAAEDTYLNSGGDVTQDGAYTVHVFNSSGTFTVGKSGLVSVEVWGGGGGGGVVAGSGGGGGGGGAYAATYDIAVTAYTSYSIVVGTGGVADNAAGGGDSSFNTDTVVADGGLGTTGETGAFGGTVANSIGAVIYKGGDGKNGNTTGDIGGGGGGAAGPGGPGLDGVAAAGGVGGNGGAGDSGLGGAGGAGGDGANGGNGGEDLVLGGGGGGGGDNSRRGGNGGRNGGGGGGGEVTGGGAGANGLVIVRCLTSEFMSDNSQTNYQMPVRIYRSTAVSTPTGGDISIVGSNTVHTFDVAGTYTFTVPVHASGTVTVECWGGGGGGFDGSSAGGGKGGGGGGYARSSLTVASGDYSVVVGGGGAAGSNGGASTWQTNVVVGDYGRGGTDPINGGGEGGMNNSGNVSTANGGAGGDGSGSAPSSQDCGGGGGGAGGPDGAGVNGFNATATTGGNGGAGDNDSGGAGGTGGNGASGSPGTANSKGGGGGGGGDNGRGGGVGGAPGGGGGGGETPTSPATNQGAAGQVVITYVTGSLDGSADGTEVVGSDIAGKVYVSDKCKPDYSDIRFTASDAVTQLDYWIEESDANVATMWVEFDSIPVYPGEGSFYIYYGNADAMDASNGTNTFLFFDDFSGDLSKWTQEVNGGNISITNGYLECGGGTNANSPWGHTALGSSATYDSFSDGIIEGDVYLTTDSIAEVGYRGDFATNAGYKSRMDARPPSDTGLSHLIRPYLVDNWVFISPGGGPTGIAVVTEAWLPFSIRVNQSTLNISCPGQVPLVGTNTTYTAAGEISLQNHYGAYSRFDNIRVRKYANPEPNWGVWGIEELPPYGTTSNISSAVFDSTQPVARWDLLAWDNSLPSGTNISFEARVSDVQFDSTNTSLEWHIVSNNPNLYGQYQQWRATLTTNSSSITPVLNEVRSLYSW